MREGRSVIAASGPLPRTPANASSPNRHRPFGPGYGNGSSCPTADLRGSAQNFAGQGQLSEAIDHFHCALESDAGDVQARFYRPNFEEAGSMGEAAAHFRQAMQADPNSEQARYQWGSGSRSRGQARRGDRPFTGGPADRSPKCRSPSKRCRGPDVRRSVRRSRGAVPGGPKIAT